jgi:hypothetical protein
MIVVRSSARQSRKEPRAISPIESNGGHTNSRKGEISIRTIRFGVSLTVGSAHWAPNVNEFTDTGTKTDVCSKSMMSGM